MSWYDNQNTNLTRSDQDLLKGLLTCNNDIVISPEKKSNQSQASKEQKSPKPQKRKRVDESKKKQSSKRRKVKIDQKDFL